MSASDQDGQVGRIYRPAKTSTQSGRAASAGWVLEYAARPGARTDPLTGYVGGSDPLQQVRLRFPGEKEALEFARENGIEVRVIKSAIRSVRPGSYADNFRYDRKAPWTH